ncbi:MAG: hypothetical protein AVDCRST_MAG59-247, partial [uncultured Thermomicrobiales bacterium]
ERSLPARPGPRPRPRRAARGGLVRCVIRGRTVDRRAAGWHRHPAALRRARPRRGRQL